MSKTPQSVGFFYGKKFHTGRNFTTFYPVLFVIPANCIIFDISRGKKIPPTKIMGNNNG
jgi:hypothetical protein